MQLLAVWPLKCLRCIVPLVATSTSTCQGEDAKLRRNPGGRLPLVLVCMSALFRALALFLFCFLVAFYSPAQLVGGFTLSDILHKAVVTGVFPPPRYLASFLSRIRFRIPTFQLFVPVGFCFVEAAGSLLICELRYIQERYSLVNSIRTAPTDLGANYMELV